MTNLEKDRCIADLRNEIAGLETSIGQLEKQLQFSMDKIGSVRGDIGWSLFFILVPPILLISSNNAYTLILSIGILIAAIVHYSRVNIKYYLIPVLFVLTSIELFIFLPEIMSVFLLFVMAFSVGLALIYLIALPFLLHQFLKALLLRKMNMEAGTRPELSEPVKKDPHSRPVPEYNLITERNKIQKILTKYYSYKNDFQELYTQIKNDDSEAPKSWIQLQTILDKYVYYEDVKPANMFTSDMIRKTKKQVLCIYLIIAAVFVLKWNGVI